MARAKATTIFALLSAASAPALGQNSTTQEKPSLEPPIPGWTIQFEPSAWYVAPGGQVLLPGATRAPEQQRIEVIDLDNPRLSPFAEVHVRRGPWRFTGGGFGFAMAAHQAAAQEAGQIGDVFFDAGDVVSSRLDFSSFEATAGYRVFEKAMNPSHGVYALVFAVDVVGGARAYDLSTTVGGPGGSTSSADEFFAEPIVGLKMDAEIYKRFTVDLQTTLGAQPLGGRTVWSWDLFVGGVWRPVENVGVQLGFRQLLFDLKAGADAEEFRFRGGMAGLYGGLELRF